MKSGYNGRPQHFLQRFYPVPERAFNRDKKVTRLFLRIGLINSEKTTANATNNNPFHANRRGLINAPVIVSDRALIPVGRSLRQSHKRDLPTLLARFFFRDPRENNFSRFLPAITSPGVTYDSVLCQFRNRYFDGNALKLYRALRGR